MPKRSFAMAIAMALFACLAFTAPSQAGLVLVTTTFGFTAVSPSTTVSDVEITYTTNNIVPHSLMVDAPTGSSGTDDGVSLVTVTFPNAMASGTAKWTFETTDTFMIGTNKIVFSGGTGATINFTISQAVIPEPTSMSLLGIGMAGLIAFRRYHRRTSKR